MGECLRHFSHIGFPDDACFRFLGVLRILASFASWRSFFSFFNRAIAFIWVPFNFGATCLP